MRALAGFWGFHFHTGFLQQSQIRPGHMDE